MLVLPQEFWYAQQIAFGQNNIPFIKGDVVVTWLERTVAALFFLFMQQKLAVIR
jgi:hypothetical protein